MRVIKGLIFFILITTSILFSVRASEPGGAIIDSKISLHDIYTQFETRVTDASNDANLDIIPGKIRVDASLDETVWEKALVWELPYERSQGENRPAPEKTLFLFVLTEKGIGFAFIALDSNPGAMRKSLTDRDKAYGDDIVFILLDTFGDKRHAYIVGVNPYGVQFDGLFNEVKTGGRNQSDVDINYDFEWNARSKMYADGFLVEGFIPWRAIRFKVASNERVTWYVGAMRRYPRDFEYEMVPIEWNFNLSCGICQLPRVHVRTPEKTSKLFNVIPYLSGTFERAVDEESTETVRDAGYGVDVKYQPHAQWVIDATILPDFSQVETDAFVITTNLRFAPFYPEKRPFFLERSDLFKSSLRLVYTRTILEPLYGIRVTGKKGSHTFAFLNVLDKQTFLLFPGVQESSSDIFNFRSMNSIFRYRYDLGERSIVGIMVLDKEYSGGYNRVFSFDGQFALSPTWTLYTTGVLTSTEYPDEIREEYDQPEGHLLGWAGRVTIGREGRSWEFRTGWEELTHDFRDDLGFIQQVGVRRIFLMNSFIFWPDSKLIRRTSFFMFTRGEWERSGPLQNSLFVIGNFTRGIGQTNLFTRFRYMKERVGTVYIEGPEISSEFNFRPYDWFGGFFQLNYGVRPEYTMILRSNSLRMRAGTNWKLFNRFFLSHELIYQKLWKQTPLQTALIQLLRFEFQFTPALGVRQIFQWRKYSFLDPRYQEDYGYPEENTALQVQTVVRYRINYASALYIGFFGDFSKFDLERRSRWNVFFKFSYLVHF